MLKFDFYEVRFELLEPLLGTVPKDPDVYRKYIASKADGMIDEETATVPAGDAEKSGWTGFHTDEDGLFLYNYAVLGFIKEAGNTLKEQVGIKALRSKIDQFVFVEPRRVRLAALPDGKLERPLRAMTMQGPRVTVVRSDYVAAGTRFAVAVRVLKNKEISGEVIRQLLEYGRYRGLGQFRNGGYGRFTFEMSEQRAT